MEFFVPIDERYWPAWSLEELSKGYQKFSVVTPLPWSSINIQKPQGQAHRQWLLRHGDIFKSTQRRISRKEVVICQDETDILESTDLWDHVLADASRVVDALYSAFPSNLATVSTSRDYIIYTAPSAHERSVLGLATTPFRAFEPRSEKQNPLRTNPISSVHLSLGPCLSPIRKEEADLQRATVHWSGHPIIWVVIAPRYSFLLESHVVEHLSLQPQCSQFLYHESLILPPQILSSWGIKFDIIAQMPGELLRTDYQTYSYAWRTGLSLSETVPWCEEDWRRPPLYIGCNPVDNTHGHPGLDAEEAPFLQSPATAQQPDEVADAGLVSGRMSDIGAKATIDDESDKELDLNHHMVICSRRSSVDMEGLEARQSERSAGESSDDDLAIPLFQQAARYTPGACVFITPKFPGSRLGPKPAPATHTFAEENVSGTMHDVQDEESGTSFEDLQSISSVESHTDTFEDNILRTASEQKSSRMDFGDIVDDAGLIAATPSLSTRSTGAISALFPYQTLDETSHLQAETDFPVVQSYLKRPTSCERDPKCAIDDLISYAIENRHNIVWNSIEQDSLEYVLEKFRPGQWLNDDAIMETLFCMTATREDVFVVNSHDFSAARTQQKPDRINRWSFPSLVLIPVFLGEPRHWLLLSLDFRCLRLTIHEERTETYKRLASFALSAISAPEREEWTVKYKISFKNDGCNCGIILLREAEQLLHSDMDDLHDFNELREHFLRLLVRRTVVRAESSSSTDDLKNRGGSKQSHVVDNKCLASAIGSSEVLRDFREMAENLKNSPLKVGEGLKVALKLYGQIEASRHSEMSSSQGHLNTKVALQLYKQPEDQNSPWQAETPYGLSDLNSGTDIQLALKLYNGERDLQFVGSLQKDCAALYISRVFQQLKGAVRQEIIEAKASRKRGKDIPVRGRGKGADSDAYHTLLGVFDGRPNPSELKDLKSANYRGARLVRLEDACGPQRPLWMLFPRRRVQCQVHPTHFVKPAMFQRLRESDFDALVESVKEENPRIWEVLPRLKAQIFCFARGEGFDANLFDYLE